ncbi:Dipeptidyl aminopeptidase/acylaminoacyl peptidase [Pseudomonas flavescens]|uniref:Dipeptidyl aminopeptidase/acylaminoacyl peptidase n=1 Tax=Phytopseudomonas flavescens TaxID=29435 RepID=A0A1G8QNI4_9GAMM|nr:S9 family peptidase [Pseudomonas flavescens]SDJ06267.1 Dipeptidyl aminopeptidase/acylaminoacyl peptidase [Pseudomonas flavescens]
MTETHASSPRVEPLCAAEAVAAAIDFAELRVGPAGLVWNEFRPEDGSCRLWLWREHAARCLTPDGFSARSRVYEYGGGSFCLGRDSLVFVNDADQQLYMQPLAGGAPQALTHGQHRYGDLLHSGEQVLAVEESHAAGQVEHRLVAITLRDGSRAVLAEGADFYASPVLSGDGRQLAWIQWQRPAQPWTATRLYRACLQGDGTWGEARCVAGDVGEEQALQQPGFDAQGRLYCLSDRNGFWQPWGETEQGWQALPARAADHAGAPWQLGACSWKPLGPQAYLASWFEDGYSRLGIRQADGSLRHYASAYNRFRSLALDRDHLYVIAASALAPSAVLAIRRDDGQVRVFAGGRSPLPPERISQPQPLHYASGDGQAHGFFYPPQDSEGLPPLLVFVHGGPTSACHPVFDPRIQYWTQRGFAVADLNYRGSTGYGRHYRQALHLSWGVVDVEDACAVVGHLAERGLIDPARAFVRGGSAGGYTTLCALARGGVFRGGASLYGVSDPLALARVTHKLEGDYLDWLIGDPQRDAERYRQRTPLRHADRITVPVIFFQGELDTVVVPEQTRAMLAALTANGIEAEAHFYAGERHGLRQAENLAHALEAEWRFYRRVLEQQGQ